MISQRELEHQFETRVHRRSHRAIVAVPSVYRVNATNRWNIRVSDLSRDGFLATSNSLIMHGPGFLLMPGLNSLRAELRWYEPSRSGFSFVEPLHPAVLDHIVTKYPDLDAW